MTTSGKMILKLSVLIIPAIILLFTLYGGPKGNSIGGGGYDLSEVVYSGLFTLFVAGWNIWILVAMLSAKTGVDKLNNKILLAVGIAALIATAAWFLRQLR